MKIDMVSDTLAYATQRWQLRNIRSLAHQIVTHNYLARAYSEVYQQEVVLKILNGNTHEMQVLAIWAGHGAVTMLAADYPKRVMLLEYVQPGTQLKECWPAQDTKATHIFAQLMHTLHASHRMSYTEDFNSIEKWLSLLDSYTPCAFSPDLVRKARTKANKLLHLDQQRFLLHGDLHHENIIQKGESWIALDPQGVLGPLEYEVGRFLMNPMPDLLEQSDPWHYIASRINALSSLGNFDPERLLAWTFVQAVLSACWAEQDGYAGGVSYFVAYAMLIEEYLV